VGEIRKSASETEVWEEGSNPKVKDLENSEKGRTVGRKGCMYNHSFKHQLNKTKELV